MKEVTIISTHNFDGLVQERRNSSALAMELRLSCTNPSILAPTRSTFHMQAIALFR